MGQPCGVPWPRPSKGAVRPQPLSATPAGCADKLVVGGLEPKPGGHGLGIESKYDLALQLLVTRSRTFWL